MPITENRYPQYLSAILTLACLAVVLWEVLNRTSTGSIPVELRNNGFVLWDLAEFKPWPILQEEPLHPDLEFNPESDRSANDKIREVLFYDGSETRVLYVHFPKRKLQDGTATCVLVPPSGSNLITGQTVNGGSGLLDHYLNKGMVVVTYELNGALNPRDTNDKTLFKQAYLQFVESNAGLLNSQNAFHYAATKIQQVDPTRIYVAGYSSGGSHALLFAAHEKRLAGCVAYCPDTTMGDYTPRAISIYGKFLPGLAEFVKRVSPESFIPRIDGPVLVFAAVDDEIVEFDETTRFCAELSAVNGRTMFRWSDSGGHVDSYQQAGIKSGADWIMKQAEIR